MAKWRSRPIAVIADRPPSGTSRGCHYELRFDDRRHEVITVCVPRGELQPHVVNLQDLIATTVLGTCAAGKLLLTLFDPLRRDIDRLHPSLAIGVSEVTSS